MAKKDKIIKNFSKYSVEDITGAIREGQLTIYELSKAGVLTPLMKRRIEAELAKHVTNKAPEQPAEPVTESVSDAERYEQARHVPEPEYRRPEPEREYRRHEPERYEQVRHVPEPEYRRPEPEREYKKPEPERYEQVRHVPEPEYRRLEPEREYKKPEQLNSVSVPPVPSCDDSNGEDTRIVQAAIPPQIPRDSRPGENDGGDTRNEDKPNKKRKKKPDPRIIPENLIDNRGMFRRPFSFRGRIRRTEYGLTILIYMLWTVLLLAATISNEIVIVIAVGLLVLPLLWFVWAEGAKRCHDLGHSGWFQLIPFYSFVMLFCEGERCSNRFGTMTKK